MKEYHIKLICLCFIATIGDVNSQTSDTTSSRTSFNKAERINRFKANFKNSTELEYIRQGLQTFRNRQNLERLEQPVSIDDLIYIENRKISEEMNNKNAKKILKFKDIQEINEGLEDYLFESDLLLSPQQIKEMLNQRRKKRQAAETERRWDKTKPINYYFSAGVNSAVLSIFRQSVKFWSDNTCLNFQESTATPNIEVISDTASCYAYLGRIGLPSQKLSLGTGCEYFGIVTHEIAHSLGFFHEHMRHDRDSFLNVIYANMDEFYKSQFIKQTTSTNNNYGQPYDWGSVMHYRDRGPDGQIHMLAKDKIYQSTMGSQYQPTFKDIYVMNLYYNCLTCTTGATCQNGGFRHPKNCNICICPNGFGGTVCNQRPTSENGAIDTGAVLTATTNYQTLSGKTGVQGKVLQRAQAVHWHINAPVGKRIEISVNFVDGQCQSGCPFGSLDLKVRNFILTGARFCCPSDIAANPILITEGNFATVSIYSIAYEHSFSLKYRIVSTAPTPSPTTTTTTTTQKPCFDIATDCIQKAYLCTNAAYLNLMKEKCQKTCGYCAISCSDIATNCVTHVALCQNSAYQQLMSEKCRKTCGYCNETPICSDIATNCVPNVALCQNPTYQQLMSEKCRKSCGYC